MGDFNIDALAERRTEKNKYIFVKDICSTFSLINLVNSFTRTDMRNGFNSKTAMDHVFTNIPESYVKTVEPHISDHNAQIAHFQLSAISNNKHQKEYLTRNFSENNMRNVHYPFCKEYHSLMNNYDDVNEYLH